MCDCPPCPFSPLSLVLAELQQTDLITSEECKWLSYISHVVEMQSSKSPEVLTKTAEVLKRHGLEKDSNLLAGTQTQPLIHVPVVCCKVEPSSKVYLKASIIIVSFMHTTLGYSNCVPELHCLST